MPIKNIVFDFGGVLLDWSPRYLFEKLIADRKELDYFLSEICTLDWNLEQDRGRSLAEGTIILQEQYPNYSGFIAEFYNQWEVMIKSDIAENVELLYALKKHYPVYGLTNFSAETLPIAKRKFSFFEIFDGIICSGVEKVVKPDNKIYELLLSRYDLRPEECVFIDDNEENIKAAQTLDFFTIHFTEGVKLKDELLKMGVLKKFKE